MPLDTKEWLNRGRMQDNQLKILKAEREKVNDMATNTTCNISDVNVQHSHVNSTENLMVSCADYSKRIKEYENKLIKIKDEILEAIMLVSDPTLRTLLLLRYIEFLTWEKVAESLNKSTYWVRSEMHRKALAEIEKIRGG